MAPAMRRPRLILFVSVVTALLAAAAVAEAATVTVHATLTGTAQPKLRLRIIRKGRTVYNQAIRSRACMGVCVSVNVPPSKSPLFEGNLQVPGGPAVVLGLFTGGAHCCFVDQVFTYDAARHAEVKTEHNFLDAGAQIVHLGRRVVFKSSDARIAEDALTDFADSGAPLQIWRFTGHRFIDVTDQYPALVRVDAARWLSAFRHHIRDGAGFITAWAADQDRLGHSALVSSTLASLAHQHKLHAAPGLTQYSQGGFVRAIKRLLRQLGYS
jgi:hypothetical protein